MLRSRTIQLAILGTLLIVVIVVVNSVSKTKPNATFVSVGTVSPAEAVDISFEKAGVVSVINKNVGDEVSAGDLIMEQSHTRAISALSAAKKQLVLDEELVLQQTKKLDQALAEASTTTTATSSSEFVVVLQKMYSTIEDAIYTKTDQIFLNPKAEKPQIAFQTDYASEFTIESGRIEVGERLASLSAIMANVSSTTDPDTISATLKKDSAEVKLYLDNVATTISVLVPSVTVSSTTVAVWKSDVTNARKQVDGSLATLIEAERVYKDPASATTSTIYKKIQGLRTDLAKALSKRANDMSMVTKNSELLSQTYVYAPVSGIIALVNVVEDEYVNAHQPVASITTSALYQIEIPIPDTVVGSLSVGSAADISIEGIDKTFRSVLVALNPTTTQGVKSYNASVQFLEIDKRLKPGAFATVTMHLK